MASSRKRLRFTFWLDLQKDDEYDLAEIIEGLKEHRLFSRTIRDGIRLILDLRQGKTEVLNELFPWVTEQPPQFTEMFAAYQANMTQHLSQLEQKLLQQTPLAVLPAAVARETLAFENDERLNLTVEKASTTDENPTFNMLISVASIDATGFIGLDLEVLEYGIKQGKIPAHFLAQKKALIAKRATIDDTQPTIPMEVPSAKLIAGSDLAFAAPDVAEIELADW